jgi:hypothetical protein
MEDSKVCPFSKLKSSKLKSSKLKSSKLKSSKLKSSKLKSSNKTPCPILNVLINKGELNPNREWTKKEISNVLQRNKLMSKMVSDIFTQFISYPNSSLFFPFFTKPFSLSVKTLRQHNTGETTAIEHDVSLSREDYHLGNHIHYSDKRFKMIYKYFKDQKSISLKELIEYMHNLYKKSKKENSKLYFKFTPFYTMLLEMVVIFILLSENNQLKLTKLEKVFKEETLDDVKINTINTGNVIINMIRAINYWNFARLKSIL